MNSLPLISVIIPVYNNEKYIESAVRSLLQQSYQKLEIIVVNDGSKDRTREILESKFSSIPNIIIINKENAGVSAARNDGIRAAHGEYIAFLDSDDEYLPDAFENMVSLIDENIDFLVCSHIKHWIKNHLSVNDDSILTKQDVYDGFIELNLTFNFIWANLYRREIITANRLFFNEQVKFAEDYEFNLNYIKHISKQIKISDKPVYLYYISRSGAHAKIDNPARDIEVILKFFDGKENTPKEIYNHFVRHYLLQCLNRYISWYPPKKAALFTKEAYGAALPFADDEVLKNTFNGKQQECISNDDYIGLVKEQISLKGNVKMEKLRFLISKTIAKTLNKVRKG